MTKKQMIFFGIIALGLICVNISFSQCDLELTGIIEGDSPLAIINGKTIEKGDEIEGVQGGRNTRGFGQA